MRRPVGSKYMILPAIILTAVIVGIAIFFTTRTNTPAPVVVCPSIDEMPFAPPSLDTIIDESAVIVEGKLERVEQFGAKVKVEKVLKGSSVRNNEYLDLCPTTFDLTKTEFGNEVIVFLKGKDQELWAGTWQGYSTVSINDSRLQVGKEIYSLDEVHKAIRK